MNKNLKNKIYALPAAALALTPAIALAQPRYGRDDVGGSCPGCSGGYERGYGMMHSWGMSGWGGFGALSAILGVIFWVAVIFGIIYLIKSMTAERKNRPSNPIIPSMNPPSSGESPLDILKKRYAKGEVSKEEFERMKNDLG
jgi:putative membrane protein